MTSKENSLSQPVDLHPASYRHLSLGHPWVIKDKFTEKFRAKSRFLVSFDQKSNSIFTLLNDTAHPKIKARLWSKCDLSKGKEEADPSQIFTQELEGRIEESLAKRLEIFKSKGRENLYLAFGEADLLPGLFLLKLGPGLIIQSYAGYWRKFQKDLIPILKKHLSSWEIEWISWQERDESKSDLLQTLLGKMPPEIHVQEWGVCYKIKLTQGYDLGLYTDMAEIRSRVQNLFVGKSFLNLYCYTGAWSLFALQKGATKVVSSDLSSKYLDWLDENLSINSFNGEHVRKDGDNKKTLIELIKNNEQFDVILCDPPSFSSDKKKSTSALKSYEETLPLMASLLASQGTCLCFLNTHSVSWKKFEEKIQELSKPLKLKIEGRLKLGADCPVLSHFPEGNYLKGLILKKA